MVEEAPELREKRLERERKEARKKELEAEMTGDLERQWQEMAEQRRQRAEVCAMEYFL